MPHRLFIKVIVTAICLHVASCQKNDTYGCKQNILQQAEKLISIGDAPQAYRLLLDLTEKADNDSTVPEQAHGLTGTLFYREELYLHAIRAHREALRYTRDKVQTARHLWAVGQSFMHGYEADSARANLEQALIIAEASRADGLKDSINNLQAALYIESGDDEAALSAISRIHKPDTDTELTQAKWYAETYRPDSASYHFKRLLDSPDINHKIEAYGALSDLAEEKDEPEEALHYRNMQVMHTQYKMALNEDFRISKLSKLYAYIAQERDFNKAEQQVAMQRHLLILSAIITLAILIFILWHHELYKRRQREKELRICKLKEIEEENKKKSLVYIEHLKTMIHSLENELEQLKDSKDTVAKQLLEAKKELMTKDMEQAVATQQMEKQAAASLVNSAIYRKIVLPSCRMRADEWEELTQTINYLYPGFIEKLNSLYPFKPVEFRLCLLLKSEIQLTQIANLLATSKQNVSSMRRRLYKKVLKQEEAPEYWDSFIRSL